MTGWFPTAPGAGVVIREARPAEARALLALVVAVDRETEFLPRDPGERPVWCRDHPEEDLAAFRVRGNGTVLVAEAGGALIGHLSANGGRHQRNHGTATLSAGVRRAWRGRGIGTRLFAAAHAWAASRHLHRLELTVIDGNEAAQRLYHRLGYADEGVMRHTRRIGGAWRDERLMARLLSPPDAPEWDPLVLDAPPPAATDGLVVRPVEVADALAYLLCDRAVRSETPFLLRTVRESLADEAATRRFLAGQRAAAGATTLVAVLNGTIAGMLSLWTQPGRRLAHEATLGVAVRRDWWAVGIGHRLMDAAVAWCRQRALHRLSLWVMGHNVRARRFYAARGFVEEATARRYALIDGRFADHVLMARLL